MSGHYGTRHRALVLASLPSRCAVCCGDLLVELRPIDLHYDAYPSPCPHCWWGVPIAPIPFRTDIPRSAA